MTEHINAEIYGWLLVAKGGPGSGRRSSDETTVEGRLITLQAGAANMAHAGANKQVLSPARLTRMAINHGKEAELLAASQGPGHEKYEALHRKASDAITAAATAASRGDADVHKKIADAAAASFAAISADKGGAITDGRAYYCIQGDATPRWLSPNPVAKGMDESLADVLRHDQDHDNWHAKHGDPPCKSEADCARMRAKYAEVKAENGVQKGGAGSGPRKSFRQRPELN